MLTRRHVSSFPRKKKYSVPTGTYGHSIFVPVCVTSLRESKKITKSNYSIRHACLSVCPSVLMEQHGSHWTEFHDIWYEDFSKISGQNARFIKI